MRGKHSCISHMFDLWNTQKTFIAKTPKGVCQRNKPDATVSWTDTSRTYKSHLESALDVVAVNQAGVGTGAGKGQKRIRKCMVITDRVKQ
jgi:hypothetical protein